MTSPLRHSTLRDFDGGLNVADNELNLDPSYQVKLDNMYRDSGGGIRKRYGTRLFCRVDSAATFTMSDDDYFEADFTLSSSPNLYINRIHHGLTTGDNITFASMGNINGILGTAIDGVKAVTVVDAHTFYINVGAFTPTDPTLIQNLSGTYTYGATSTMTGNILNMTYYNDFIVVATTTGQIAKVNGAGVLTRIWDAAIAAGLGVAFWSSTAKVVNFAEFGGELIAVNGVDKPLLITAAFGCNYLKDIPTGSNANTPIGRYIVAMNHFLIIAGNATNPSTLYISHKDASGTWAGDPAPNIARNDDLSKIAGTSEIRGLGRYRDRPVVAFDKASLFPQIDRYTSAGAHDPLYQDAVDQYGSVSHRSMISVGDEFLMCDNNGIPSVSQALFTGTLRPRKASRNVDPLLRSMLRNLDETALLNRVFAVYNRIQDQYMLFVPNHPNDTYLTETTGFIYTSKPGDKKTQWARFTGWNWRAACLSFLNRVFLADTTRIYVYGSEVDEFFADRINGPNGATGDDVSFDNEMPWVDFGDRTGVKTGKYISLETQGTSSFTLETYVDNIRYDEDNADDPELTLQFVGGDSGGYGNYDQPYGGGRRTIEERLWAWPVRFKIAKYRIKGSSKDDLRLISLTVSRLHGSNRR
jgi:hypothetical protein